MIQAPDQTEQDNRRFHQLFRVSFNLKFMNSFLYIIFLFDILKLMLNEGN